MQLSGGALPGANPNKNPKLARQRHIEAVEAMYDLLGVDKEERSSRAMMVEATGMNESAVANMSTWLIKHGFLTIRYVKPADDSIGKWSLWKLSGSKEEAVAALKASWEAQRNAIKKRPVKVTEPEPQEVAADAMIAIAPEKSAEETRAIAGPEPESPFETLRSLRKDESGALVHAAREYNNRQKLVDDKLRELEAAGIHVDRSAIKFDRDERLEAVSLALPYITMLENSLHNLSEQNDSLRKRMADYTEMRRNYEALRRRFERDIAAKVANA